MCGRFVVTAGKQAIIDLFGILDDSCAYVPSYRSRAPARVAPVANVVAALPGQRRTWAPRARAV